MIVTIPMIPIFLNWRNFWSEILDFILLASLVVFAILWHLSLKLKTSRKNLGIRKFEVLATTPLLSTCSGEDVMKTTGWTMLFLFVWFIGIVLISAQFTRETIYHSMNDRGVYLPDDYNSDLPPAQVSYFIYTFNSNFSALFLCFPYDLIKFFHHLTG